MTCKLIDLYNTKFFYKTFCNDLYYFFSAINRLRNGEDFHPNIGNEKIGEVYEAARRGEPIVIDLADARLSSDILRPIYSAEDDGIVFIDTMNAWRNNIFKENARRRQMKMSKLKLPEFTPKTDIKEYMKSLHQEAIYDAVGQPVPILIAITCLAMLMRPSLRICIDSIASTLFKYVNTKIPTEEVLNSSRLWMCTNEGVLHVSADNIYVQEAQKVLPVKEALQYAILIPAAFGEEVLLHNQAYQGLFRSCLLILQEFQENSPKTLEEILT